MNEKEKIRKWLDDVSNMVKRERELQTLCLDGKKLSTCFSGDIQLCNSLKDICSIIENIQPVRRPFKTDNATAVHASFEWNGVTFIELEGFEDIRVDKTCIAVGSQWDSI